MKTLKNIFIFLLFISSAEILSQTTILNENFDNNNNGWVIGNNNTRELKLFNGRYYFEHKPTSSSWTSSSKKFTLSSSQNFELETSIQKISGVNDYGFGLFLKDNNNNAIELSIAANGHYRTDKLRNGKYNTLKGWTKSSLVKTGNYSTNKLKIKKVGNTFTFYINGSLVDTQTLYDVSGSRVGFVINKNQKISVDYVTLKTISGSSNTYVNNNSSGGKSLPFYDSFNNNNKGWPLTDNSDIDYSLTNGKYYLDHLRESGGYRSSLPISINESKDFVIETKIDKISGVTDTSFGISWGRKGNNSFRFFITATGYYKFVRLVNDKEEKIFSWTKSSYINKGNGSSNTLKVKKENNRYTFYINGNYVNEYDFEPFFGNYVGFLLFNRQKIAVDYLDVKYLSKKSNNTNYIANKTLNVPLRDDFASNSNNWILGSNSNYDAKITNGKFILEKKNKGGLFFKNQIAIDDSKDFVIEFGVEKLSGLENQMYGITFGRKNSANEYSFILSNTGSYLFRKFVNDKYHKLIPWTDAPSFNKKYYTKNNIKITKSNNLLRFYINGTYVNEYPFDKLYGNQIGFTLYDKQKIAIDYLDVKYIEDGQSDFNSPPIITISEPNVELKRGFKIVKTKTIPVRGYAKDDDGIFEITVNGVEANVSEDGTFSANVPLKYGKNDLVVKATDMKKSSSSKTFVIKRSSASNGNNNIIVNNNSNDNIDIGFGKYHALLIGVSDYKDETIQDLDGKPTRDAQLFADVLVKHYNFDRQNVKVLKNPTKNQIAKEFFRLRKVVGKNDNILVFFAGHGNYDESNELGYWMPADAEMEFEGNIIRNSTIVDYFKAIKSKHSLLIADACFSGSILKTRSYKKAPKSVKKKYDLVSRNAITSGTLTTVPNESVFIKYVLKRLRENRNSYLSSQQLFNMIEDPVINNTTGDNKPQFGVIQLTGHEGGDFIFIKRQ